MVFFPKKNVVTICSFGNKTTLNVDDNMTLIKGWRERMQPVSVELLETQVREQKVIIIIHDHHNDDNVIIYDHLHDYYYHNL